MDDLALEEAQRYLHTMTIGRVTRFDAENQTVDVEILPKRTFMGTDTIVSRPLGTLNDVPLGFTRVGGKGIFLDISVGSLVELRFAMHSIAEVVTSNGACGVVQPTLLETHAFNDAIAVPIDFGRRPEASVGADVEIIGGDIRLGSPAAAEHVVLAGLQGVMNTLVGELNTAIANAAVGTVTAVTMGTIPVSSHTRVS
jgi:hypothetical protein